MRTVCRTQGTAEWLQARVGKVTASRIADAMRKLQRKSGDREKGDWHGDHDTYVKELAWELITRTPAEHYVTKPMEIGAQYENEARVEYEMTTGQIVDQTGFVLHPTLPFFGCSPDGLVLSERLALPANTEGAANVASLGILEIKVPLLKTHESYLLADVVPEEYIPQMQCEMLCCDAEWGDFVSYAPPDIYPELPEQFRLFRKRLYADRDLWALMEEAATATIEQATAMVTTINARYQKGTQ